jgi:UDP-GlcNAc:undecaprenyl-phosphate GlcNAc-1-phosphate transferase
MLAPLFRIGALKYGLVDRPGLHKTHSQPIALLGGLALFTSIFISLLIYLPLNGMLVNLVIAAIIIIITGLVDDNYNMKPLVKLTGQLAAASIMVFGNAGYLAPLIKLFGRIYLPGFVTMLGMVFFIVLMINAFNLIDGMDGLLAGVAAIMFMGMAVKTIISGGSANILALQLIGFGACTGFLPFNVYPAKIFMGDTGSMLLGFLLSATFLFGISAEQFSGALVLGSIYIFAYPLLDVAFAIYRRARGQCSILQADRCHIHHLIMGLGFPVGKTIATIYVINIFFIATGLALILLKINAIVILVIGFLTALAAVLLIRRLANMGVTQGIIKFGKQSESTR